MHVRKSSLSPAARFWSYVDIRDEKSCWVWTGPLQEHGYGYFHVSSSPKITCRPSRFAWTITKGPVPEGLNVCHHCDNPPCCNPAHLFVGTQLDNVRDMAAKGRRAYQGGELSGRAKLTWDIVRDIRNNFMHVSANVLAEKYGVGETAIRYLKQYKTWKES